MSFPVIEKVSILLQLAWLGCLIIVLHQLVVPNINKKTLEQLMNCSSKCVLKMQSCSEKMYLKVRPTFHKESITLSGVHNEYGFPFLMRMQLLIYQSVVLISHFHYNDWLEDIKVYFFYIFFYYVIASYNKIPHIFSTLRSEDPEHIPDF